jgi:hypothetical protein
VLLTLGHTSVVPDLREHAMTGAVDAFIASAAAATTDDAYVLVGHSGAGPLLASIAAGASRPPQLIVFVDAGLPGVGDDERRSRPTYPGYLSPSTRQLRRRRRSSELHTSC